MALYDYSCEACGHTFESNQQIADRDVPCSDGCPVCSEKKVIRCLAAPMTAFSVLTSASTYGKVPQGFKEILKNMDKNTPGSNIKKSSSFDLN